MMLLCQSFQAILLLILAFWYEQSSAFVPVYHQQHASPTKKTTSLFSSTTTTTSAEFSMDPTSPQAKDIMNHLGLTSLQHKQLAALAVLVVDWNQKINLVSRKECTRDVVFGRHVLPSLAPLALKEMLQPEMRIVDVGTGGGFPGLPLAIAYPNCQFLLVDSVGKKLTAVKDMAETLKLTNVKIHHGRAELLEDDYDICVGRSVAALPSFCFWIQNLLGDKAKLLYLIGGELEENLLQEAKLDREIDVLLECPGASDKRVLVFDKAAIKRIAKTSGLKLPKNQKLSMGKPKKKRAKGEWMKRDNSVSKQRGYEHLKRYNSISE